MRLIDADALPVSKEYCVDEAGFGASFYVVHKSDIDNAPTVDAVEVVHGEWKAYKDESMICATEFVCSTCGESFCSGELTDEQFVEMMKYCPNCGAKMDGERKVSE